MTVGGQTGELRKIGEDFSEGMTLCWNFGNKQKSQGWNQTVKAYLRGLIFFCQSLLRNLFHLSSANKQGEQLYTPKSL